MAKQATAQARCAFSAAFGATYIKQSGRPYEENHKDGRCCKFFHCVA
jgi:hypothetical protein